MAAKTKRQETVKAARTGTTRVAGSSAKAPAKPPTPTK
jgi:hypothetical protein